MTRDEIEALTADELRVMIAEHKGWKISWDGSKLASHVKYVLVNPDGKQCTNLYPFPFSAWLEAFNDDLPDWPNDIAAAWVLVEEMAKAAGVVNVQTESTSEWGLSSIVYYREYPTYGSKPIVEQGATAPLAICRAWLLWKTSCQENE